MRVHISFIPVAAIVGLSGIATADTTALSKPPAKPKPVQVAVFQLEAAGVEQKVSTIVSDAIIAELSKAPGIKVIGSKEIDAMLSFEQKKQMTGCTDTSCMVALGGALGVDKILTGNIGKLGESYVFNLKLLDIRTATMDALYNNRLKGGSEEAFLDLVPVALATVFPASAAVWSKKGPGTDVGAAGLSAEAQRAKSEARGAEPARLGATAPKPVSAYAPWILVGAGAAAVVAGGVTHAIAAKDFGDYKSRPESDPTLNDTWRSINTKANVAYGLYDAGVLMAAGGLAWYLLARNEPTSASVPTIVPLAEPDGIGAAFHSDW